MSVFKGAGVAIVTPMKENGEVDYEQFAHNIEFQIKGKTDAIIVCGTTGEASTLSHEEHLDVIDFCIKQVAGRIPVIAGTGSNCTETAIYLSTEAEKRGADAVLVVSPYYNKATQNGLYEHFKKVAESIRIPVIIYNIPGRTGVNIQPSTLKRLCEDVDNIVGVKEATGDLSQTARLIAMTDGKLDVYCGDDNQVLPFMSLGAKGVISVLSNIAPEYTHDMCQAYLDGEVEKARKMQLKAISLIDALFSEVNPIPVKKAMSLMGQGGNYLRGPLTPMEEAHGKALEEEMRKFGIDF